MYVRWGVDLVNYGSNGGANFVNFYQTSNRWWSMIMIKVFPFHVFTRYELILIDVFSWLFLESVSEITFGSSKIIIIIIIVIKVHNFFMI